MYSRLRYIYKNCQIHRDIFLPDNLYNFFCFLHRNPQLKPVLLMYRWQEARPEVESITSEELNVLMQEFSEEKAAYRG